jgi:hypothetical protein
MKNMTQEQAIQRGFTHFIEVWRSELDKEGYNEEENYVSNINSLDNDMKSTKESFNLYTVAIFLIKPKH